MICFSSAKTKRIAKARRALLHALLWAGFGVLTFKKITKAHHTTGRGKPWIWLSNMLRKCFSKMWKPNTQIKQKANSIHLNDRENLIRKPNSIHLNDRENLIRKSNSIHLNYRENLICKPNNIHLNDRGNLIRKSNENQSKPSTFKSRLSSVCQPHAPLKLCLLDARALVQLTLAHLWWCKLKDNSKVNCTTGRGKPLIWLSNILRKCFSKTWKTAYANQITFI